MFRYFVLIAILVCVQSKKDFTGHRLISIQAKNEADLGLLRDLENSGEIELDFWTEPSLVRETDIRVPPDSFKQLKKLLKTAGLKYKEVKSNIQDFIDAEERSMASRTGKSITNSYLTYNAIEDFVYQMEADYGTRVQVTIYGNSHEGRPLFQVKIAADLQKPKPAIWIEAGTHAREWITVSTAVNLIHTLASNTADGNAMLANYDWYITPSHNPDGYEYTDYDRMWRKNREFAGTNWWGEYCYGTDLNRNWGAYWGGPGASTNPCSDTYRGTEAFSAPETLALKKAVEATPDVFAFFSIHSYSQFMLVPYGYTSEKPSNYNYLACVAQHMMDALRVVDDRKFVVGTPNDLLNYVASGGAYDYFFEQGIEYSYTYELRPATSSEGGFVLPADHIEPAARETIASLKAFSTEKFDC